MYKHFFGFKELPFKLVPSPDYLFLSRHHEEALAHLKYAALMGDGFAVITGEVGTGKTTLCRTFLENLDQTVEAAYIFNPRLGPLDLLKNINQEFGLPVADNAKDLIDDLNRFLIEQNGAGKRVILVIDEAQNLAMDVLEQLRLLSNLETTQSKLIQIILVGQPELAEMLDSHQLRQLSQRITLRCHLFPLSFRDTGRYIRHRIHIASCRDGVVFTRGAVRRIHAYSRGIPRLVNIAADRSLLTAFGKERRKITASLAGQAIRELAGHRDRTRRPVWPPLLPWVAGGALLLAVFGTVRLLPLPPLFSPGPAGVGQEARLEDGPEARPKAFSGAAIYPISPPEAHADEAPADAPLPAAAPASQDLSAFLRQLGQDHAPVDLSRSAVRAVIRRWQPDADLEPLPSGLKDAGTAIMLMARRHGFHVQAFDAAALPLVQKLNLPAVVEFASSGPDGAGSVCLALTSVRDGKALLLGGSPLATLAVAWENLATAGEVTIHVLWKDCLGIPVTIRDSTPKDAILLLKMHLHEIGFTFIEMNPVFDEDTRSIIREIQTRAGIPVDGRVGPLTKMVLCSEKQGPGVPHLAP